MKEKKFYPRIRFSPEVIKQASLLLARRAGQEAAQTVHFELETQVDGAEWSYDSESDFFNDYRRCVGARYQHQVSDLSLSIHYVLSTTIIEASAPDRSTLEEVFEIFEKHRFDTGHVQPSIFDLKKPVVFIGHGPSSLWQKLEAHLHHRHGYSVIAYVIGGHAGDDIREILETLFSNDFIAFIVMTREDADHHTSWRIRQNAIYEMGLLQGRLGLNRVIVVLESEIQELSTIYGIEEIRFTKGDIREAFGRIVAAVQREFPQ